MPCLIMLKSFRFAVREPHAKTKASQFVNNQLPETPSAEETPFQHTAPIVRLDGGLVGNGSQGLGAVLLEGDLSCVAGQGSLTLDLDGGALSLGLGLQRGVLLDSAQETLPGARGLDVLNAEVDALLDVSVLDLLVDDDTDSGLGDVVDDTSLAVVDLVGHTVIRNILSGSDRLVRVVASVGSSGARGYFDLPLLDGTVGLDVHNVTNAMSSVRSRSILYVSSSRL